MIKRNSHVRLGDVVQFSKETTDYSEFESGTFEYLEISEVSLGVDKYKTTTTLVNEAPSRAKMKTTKGDIAVALTRPHRGAIALIKDTGIIASTGFLIIRDVDSTIDKDWLLFVLLSNVSLQQMLQRSSGGNYPAIIEDEVKRVYIPVVDGDKQRKMVSQLKESLTKLEQQLNDAETTINIARKEAFDKLGIHLPDYHPSLYSYSKLGRIKEIGIYCNPHSAYFNELAFVLKKSPYHLGSLEQFVDINPSVNRMIIKYSSTVSFVPMSAVAEKTNQVIYEQRRYEEVKTGFTPFQRGDLLWAKITPCMQNGKSFLSNTLPTEYGFGSTEFHVLRQKSDRIYMPFLWVLLSDDHILEAAQGMFSGSAGQQRVPDTFLKKFPIILPPIEVQRELADKVLAALETAKKMKEAAELEWAEAKAWFEKELLGK